jgi:hypothetical protein
LQSAGIQFCTRTARDGTEYLVIKNNSGQEARAFLHAPGYRLPPGEVNKQFSPLKSYVSGFLGLGIEHAIKKGIGGTGIRSIESAINQINPEVVQQIDPAFAPSNPDVLARQRREELRHLEEEEPRGDLNARTTQALREAEEQTRMEQWEEEHDPDYARLRKRWREGGYVL